MAYIFFPDWAFKRPPLFGTTAHERVQGRRGKKVITETDRPRGFRISGKRFYVSRRYADMLRATWDHAIHDVRCGDELMPGFFPDELVSVSSSVAENSPLAKNDFADVRTSIENVLAMLSAFSGKEFHLHVECDGSFQPYNDNAIHVVLGAQPSGESMLLHASYIYDVLLDPKGRDVVLSGMALGQGRIVENEEACKVGQIIGSTFFLFLPTQRSYVHLLAGRGTELFRMVLRAVWNEFISPASDESESHTITAFAEYSTLRGMMALAMRSEAENQIKRIDAEIESLGEQIRSLVARKTMLIAYLWSGFDVPDRKLCEREWAALSGHPLVDHFEQSKDKALHIYTKPVHMRSPSGDLYDVGLFVVRSDLMTHVSVWSVRPTHKDRVPHPHITAMGGECFGNATIEVKRQIGEDKHGDALLLVLNWLENGYDPALAEHKLEEWPKVDTTQKGADTHAATTHEFLPSAETLRPEADPTGRSDRLRLDRIVRSDGAPQPGRAVSHGV